MEKEKQLSFDYTVYLNKKILTKNYGEVEVDEACMRYRSSLDRVFVYWIEEAETIALPITEFLDEIIEVK